MVQSGGDIPGAVQSLEDAIREQAARKEAYYYLAVCRKMQGQVDEALSVLEKGMAVDEDAPRGYAYAEEDIGLWKLAYERCFLLFRQSRYREALEAVDKLMDVDEVPDIEYRFLASLKDKIMAREASGSRDETVNKS
jgi:tetratricopeptide (TPR) repeat protein